VTQTFSTPAAIKYWATGIAVDGNGDIFVGNNNAGGVTKFKPDGSVIWSAPNQVGAGSPYGCVVDSNNDVWLINKSNNTISKYRGSDGAPLGVFPVGDNPYTYTDATGQGRINTTQPSGWWTVIQDSGIAGTAWGAVSWNGNTPPGTAIKIEVRAADSEANLDAQNYTEVANGASFCGQGISGKFIQIRATLSRLVGQTNSPVLYDLSVDCCGRGDPCTNSVTRTWEATDAAGNSAVCSQTVTIVDTTPPVLSGCPRNAVYQCRGDVPPPALVTATDACQGTVPVTFAESETKPGSSCSNVITRTWSAVDSCGNSSSCRQLILVQDTKPPVLSGCPSNAVYQCRGDVPSPAPVTALDACQGAVPVTFAQTETIPGSSCSNLITRTWSAVDSCGNSSLCQQLILVQDTTPPALTCPADLVITNDSPCQRTTLNLPAPVASDNCSTPTVVQTRSDGQPLSAPYPVGFTTIRCVATDACGNSSSCSYKVTVVSAKFIASDFNGTAIPGNAKVWFNSNLKVDRKGACPVTITFYQQTISSSKFNLMVPDAQIRFVSGTCPASTVFSNGMWVTTVGCDYTGPVFLSGLAYQVPTGGLPGGVKPVTWSGTFISDTPGVTVHWAWGAAAYTAFADNNNSIGVKPIEGSQCSSYANSDHAGTPENYKGSVIGGARGGGGSNWTGSWSGTLGLVPCFYMPVNIDSVQALPTVTLQIESIGGKIRLTWPAGVLQEAENIGGPYADVIDATSPYEVTPVAAKKAYRVRVQ
jgi:hypothetical protein